MPLLVHCPNNCQMRLPANRMGKVVRCVDCQTPLRIPELDSPLLRTGNWVECRAKRAIKKTDQINNAHDIANQTASSSLPIQTDPTPNNPKTTSAFNGTSAHNAGFRLEPPPQNARLLRAKPWRMVEPLTTIEPEAHLTPIDLELAPASTYPAPKTPSRAQERSVMNLESNQEAASINNADPTDWLSIIRELFWYETPADDEPPQSV